MTKLPINIEDLLRQRTVESDRIEYKAGWNAVPIMQTICAFANDFENLGGGYIIIGQDTDNDTGLPIFPPVGVSNERLDSIQLELQGFCNQIRPTYFPILSVEEFEGKKLIVIWAPGGQNRPYSVPRDIKAKTKVHSHFIRRYTSTVQIKDNSEEHRELLTLTATIPFDDRQCQTASLTDLRTALIRDYLEEVGSDLADEVDSLSHLDLCRQMKIVDGPDEAVRPKNIGLLFFSTNPKEHLPGAQIDVVIFPKGPGGGEIIEKEFTGPIHEQIRAALRYIQNEVVREKITKLKDQAEALRITNYPLAAIEEALVNAVFHRSYERPEPVEVRVSPDRIEIVSYPGPDPSIKIEALNAERLVARRYRNRRIGDFLKELGLSEGRCTGIPTMREAMTENGSPKPRFETDKGRTYFFVELLSHPDLKGLEYPDINAGLKEAISITDRAAQALAFIGEQPRRKVEIAESLGLKARSGSLKRALKMLLDEELVDFTIPDKPRSKNQKYQVTDNGAAFLRQ